MLSQRPGPLPTSQSFATEEELLKKKRIPLDEAQRSSYAGTTLTGKDDDDDFVDVNAVNAAKEPETPNPEGRTRMGDVVGDSRAPVILTSKTAFSSLHKKRHENDVA